MLKDLPTDLVIPELEYFLSAWRSECVSSASSKKPFESPPGCRQLLLESEKLKELTKEAYVSSGLNLNTEYSRLCRTGGMLSVANDRCSLLLSLGANRRELSYFNIVSLVVLAFALYIWLQKKKNKYQGSMRGALVRICILTIVSLVVCGISIMVGFNLRGVEQILVTLLPVSVVFILFYFLFSKLLLNRTFLITAALIFSLASNFVTASHIAWFINEKMFYGSTQWRLSENSSINEKIQKILRGQSN